MQIRAENREKVKIIVVAACAAFAVLMLISLIVGLVSLASATSRKERLERQLADLNARLELGASNLEYYKSDEYIEMIAREFLNMKGKDEISFVGK